MYCNVTQLKLISSSAWAIIDKFSTNFYATSHTIDRKFYFTLTTVAISIVAMKRKTKSRKVFRARTQV